MKAKKVKRKRNLGYFTYCSSCGDHWTSKGRTRKCGMCGSESVVNVKRERGKA